MPPRSRLAPALALDVASSTLTCCGGTARSDDAKIQTVPLAPHVRVAGEARGCPFVPDVCYRWAIFEGPPATTAARLKAGERHALVARGWYLRRGTSRAAVAGDSPDGKWFVSFETGPEELADARNGRSSWGDRELVRRLRASIAHKRPTLAVTLELGEGR
jgi:hypothetical protein